LYIIHRESSSEEEEKNLVEYGYNNSPGSGPYLLVKGRAPPENTTLSPKCPLPHGLISYSGNATTHQKTQITSKRIRRKVSRQLFRCSSPTAGFFKLSTIFDPRYTSFRFGYYRTPTSLNSGKALETTSMALPTSEEGITKEFVGVVKRLVLNKVKNMNI
jgi:hypothetical protein